MMTTSTAERRVTITHIWATSTTAPIPGMKKAKATVEVWQTDAGLVLQETDFKRLNDAGYNADDWRSGSHHVHLPVVIRHNTGSGRIEIRAIQTPAGVWLHLENGRYVKAGDTLHLNGQPILIDRIERQPGSYARSAFAATDTDVPSIMLEESRNYLIASVLEKAEVKS